MLVNSLISDLSKLCLSYLSNEEQIYYSNEWNKFDGNDICDIAMYNGWFDLLIWSYKQKNIEIDMFIYSYFSLNLLEMIVRMCIADNLNNGINLNLHISYPVHDDEQENKTYLISEIKDIIMKYRENN